jgi:WD40 repeat protein
MQSQQIVTTLEGTPDYGATLLFGPSGSKLIVNTASGFDSMFGSAGIDPGGMLKVWNLEIPSQPVLLYEIWEADIREVQFSPDEQDLVFTSRSQLSPNNFLSHVHIVELSTGVEQQLPGSGPLSYSGTTLVFSLEGALLAWDGTQLEQVPVSVNSKKYYLSPQQDRVVTLAYPGATRKEIQLYDLATGLQLASTSMLPSMPWYSLAADLDSTNPSLYLIAAGNEYGHLAVWKIRADSTETVDVPRESFVTGISSQLAFSPNEQILAALSHKYGSCEGVWDLLDLQHSEHITSAAFMSDQDCTVSLPLVVAFHPVNPTIVTGHADGSIRLWNIEQMISVFRIHSEAESESVLVPGDGSPVTSLAYNPYGTLLAYSHENSTTVINVQTNEVLYDLPASGSIVFSPDGSLLVVGLTVFNVRTGQQVLSLPPAQAESAAFSPDGSLLVTTSMLFACLWNVQTGEEVICIPGNLVRNGMIRAVFTPDGKLLVTAGEDGVIRLWGVSTTQ